jgi:hypothetical protein
MQAVVSINNIASILFNCQLYDVSPGATTVVQEPQSVCDKSCELIHTNCHYIRCHNFHKILYDSKHIIFCILIVLICTESTYTVK